MSEDDAINAYGDWMRGEPDTDEPREGDACAVCGGYWPRWVESRGAWLCEGCAPLATIHDRCMRGDL